MRTEDVLDQIDGALEDWGVGPDAMRMNAPSGTRRMSNPIRFQTSFTFNADAFREAVRRMDEQVRRLALAYSKSFAAIARAMQALNAPMHDRHHPKPLCIDGHAYRQRRRNRRKR